jgi:signal peptidase
MKLRISAIILLIILLAIGNSLASILSENYLYANGTNIHQTIVSIESDRMSPNLNTGDIVVVEDMSRKKIITMDQADKAGYKAFSLAGDVIFYRPYGKESFNLLDQAKILLGISIEQDRASPIFGRALCYVENENPMWNGGPNAPFSGYITKGDHNDVIDQMAGQIFGMANLSYVETHRKEIMNVGSNIFLDKKTGMIIYRTENGTFVGEGISYLTPVKEEWIIGVARVRIRNGSDWTAISPQ